MDPITTSAIISGGAGLFSKLFNSFSSNKAARENAKLEAETNKWITEQNIKSAKDLTTMQNEYNTEMWHKQNAYNDPANQAALYEKAGFNKQAVLGQFSSSAASAQGAAGIMPDLSAGKGSRKKVAFQLPEIGEALASIIGTLSAVEDLKKKQIDNRILSIYGNDMAKYDFFIKQQQYHMNGGDWSEKNSSTIRRYMDKKWQYQTDILKSQRDMYNAQLADYYSYKRPYLKQSLKQIQNSNWEYDTARKPFVAKYGAAEVGVKALNGALSSLLGTFGSLWKSFFK